MLRTFSRNVLPNILLKLRENSYPFRRAFPESRTAEAGKLCIWSRGLLSSPTTTANLKLAALGSSSSSSLRMRRNSPGGMPAPSLSKTSISLLPTVAARSIQPEEKMLALMATSRAQHWPLTRQPLKKGMGMS